MLSNTVIYLRIYQQLNHCSTLLQIFRKFSISSFLSNLTNAIKYCYLFENLSTAQPLLYFTSNIQKVFYLQFFVLDLIVSNFLQLQIDKSLSERRNIEFYGGQNFTMFWWFYSLHGWMLTV